MGRKAKSFSISAYVLGADYMRYRDSLMRACDAEGPGELVHPYLGTISVLCSGYSLSESKNDGGMAQFTMTMVESGETDFPSDSVDTIAGAFSAADEAVDASVADFADNFSIDGQPDFSFNDAKALLDGGIDKLRDMVKSIRDIDIDPAGVINQIDDFATALGDLMEDPAKLAGIYHDLVQNVSDLFDPVNGALESLQSLFDFGDDVGDVGSDTETRAIQQANREAIIGLVQQAAVIESGRIAPSATFATQNEAEAARDSITDAIDVLMESGKVSDDLFSTLQDVRTAVVDGVPNPSVALPTLMTITPAVTVPSLVLAYDTYEDANRADEIVARNNLKYSGFVPGAEPLQIVSNG
jgi:prophage DNA circulation protein